MRRLAAVLATGLLAASCGGRAAPATSSTSTSLSSTTAAVATSGPASTTAPATTTMAAVLDRLAVVEIPAPALAGNLLGEEPVHEITVYLPPGYADGDRQYPVVYYLPGYGDTVMGGVRLPEDVDALVAAGMPEMILVVADGRSVLRGSFFVDSAVGGDWESYLVQDVVGYVDAHYRTLPVPASRGIAGHSMGGFGAWQLALSHPGTFGAVYVMSPGLFDPAGLAESQMFAAERTIEGMVSFRERVAGLGPEEVPAALRSAPDLFAVAYGVAFAPNPESPLLFDYPYTRADGALVRDDAVWARWEAGFGDLEAEVAAGAGGLSRLHGLVIDYGRRDEYAWIPKGCVYLAQVLTEAAVPHRVAAHDGTHSGGLGDRIREHMLPFFGETLSTG